MNCDYIKFKFISMGNVWYAEQTEGEYFDSKPVKFTSKPPLVLPECEQAIDYYVKKWYKSFLKDLRKGK